MGTGMVADVAGGEEIGVGGEGKRAAIRVRIHIDSLLNYVILSYSI